MSDNRNQAIIMAVGVGAVGTILAYLGYSIFSDETNKENVVDDVGEELENTESLLTTKIDVDSKEKPSIFYNFWTTFNKSDENKIKVESENNENDDDYKQRYHY